ncbi:MAG: HDOD domain-containing protein [Candidatus Brocadia sp.]|jgi:HD-like signal output (HDOD) protein
MKRILFVDDELKVLQGLQRMLRSMRHEWNMEFATSGHEALETLSKSPFDVIVTDMRMPGMDGVQLLREVMKKHPGVIRIILSGQTDQGVFLSSSHLMHQFLSKPCDTESLKATIARACALHDLVKDESLKKLVLQVESLPSLSKLYTEILEMLQSPDVSMEKLGDIISRDLGMTAKILQIVNSAFYGLRRRISNPTEAVIILGLSTLRALVLSYQLFSSFEHIKLERFSANALWKHSMIVGTFTKQIARDENCPPKMLDDALIAGMFHDIGKLIIVANLPLRYDKMLDLVREKNIPHREAEQEIFNGTHAEIGAYLLGLWGLSDSIIEAIAFHHVPTKCPAKTFTLVTAVHIADVLGNMACPVESETGSQVDYDYITEIGMSERLSVWRESCMGILSKEITDG